MAMKWWGWGSTDIKTDVNKMPMLIPFIKDTIGCDTTHISQPVDYEKINIPTPKLNQFFYEKLLSLIHPGQIYQDKMERLLHCYGKSFKDLYRIRNGLINTAPDLVIYPENSKQILEILILAKQANVCVIPFGGGTNIVSALEVNKNEDRMVISLDLTRMNKLLSIDKDARVATFESGVLGPDLEEQLNKTGFTLGHFPDSFQFSTLGGWLATRSAGMNSDKYGTISDMVLSMEIITPDKIINQPLVPHSSTGPEIYNMFLGSEGTLGVISKAVMKIHPIESFSHFAGVMFPNFDAGINALKLTAQEKKLPNMMRLMDNDETVLSFNLKPPTNKINQFVQKSFKKYLKFKNISDDKCCLMIIAFSGDKNVVKKHKKDVLQICKNYKGIYLGQSPGNSWFERKYDYPYLRDFVMDFGCVVDVSETSTTWNNIKKLYNDVKKAGIKAMSECTPKTIQNRINKSGYLGCHISHNYYNGACLYFTFCFSPEKNKELSQYWHVKKTLTEAILKNNGALSHHHSVGRDHAPWLKEYIGETGLDAINSVKQTIDPTNILNPDKLISQTEILVTENNE